MSETLERVKALVGRGELLVSAHGYEELNADGILASEAIDGLAAAVPIEDYPDAARGPTVLVLEKDIRGPIHVVWGIPRGHSGPAVLVTAYRPDPEKWTEDFMRRRVS